MFDSIGILRKGTTTGLAVTGVGLVVAGVGKMVGGQVGAGLMGFGLAHVALGLLDMTRPAVRL